MWGRVTLNPEDIIFGVKGPDSASRAGYYINCVGDINSDGYSDIVAYFKVSSELGSEARIFFGGNPPDTLPDVIIKGGWGPPSAIDLTGDGINEIVSANEAYLSFPCEDGTVYFHAGYSDSIGTVPYDSLLPDTDNYSFGWECRTAYFDSDAFGDLLVLKYCRPLQQLLL